MADTMSALQVAREASKRVGRTVTDKQVRGLARDIIGRFDKSKHPNYQAHAYTAAERTVLINALLKRAGKPNTSPRKPKAPTAPTA